MSVDLGNEVLQSISSGVITREALRFALRKLCEKFSNSKKKENYEELPTGEQTIEDLSKSRDTKEVIEVHNDDIDELRAELRPYGVDFAVIESSKQNGIDDKIYKLVFKAKDTAILNNAIKKVAAKYGEKDRMADQMQHAEDKARQQAEDRDKNISRDVNRIKDHGLEH